MSIELRTDSGLHDYYSCDPRKPTAMDPTSRGDMIASRMRDYYEANRETWLERRHKHWTVAADNLMLGLLGVVITADRELPK